MTLMQFFSQAAFFRKPKMLLLFGSTICVLAAIILQNKGVLPLDSVSFIFFTFVLFLLALYRLSWAFLLFVAMLPLETINVAPDLLRGLALRPYQWLGGVTLLAVFVRFFLGRLPFRLFQPRWFDILLPLLSLGGLLALFNAPNVASALKQAVVVVSFVALYFLGRIFFRTSYDVMQAVPFFLSSSVVVLGYAVWQNVQALFGREGFQVMVGRPNATFSEADWLGMFVGIVMATFLVLAGRLIVRIKKTKQSFGDLFLLFGVWLGLMLSYLVLILTVARSAWLGAAAILILFACGFCAAPRLAGIRVTLRNGIALFFFTVTALGVAATAVTVFHLSPFQFWNRIQSTGSGLQQITVSCYSADTALPQSISNLTELEQNGCRHIRLEDIVEEKQAGRFIHEIYRPDPNIELRKNIYQYVFGLLKEHPLLGIGWGSAATYLGTDGRGAGLNASNVFLEVWLGSGLLGLMSFCVLIGGLLLTSFQWYRSAAKPEEVWLALFLFAALGGMMVFNMFNSGLLLGFFFLSLAVATLSLEHKSVDTTE